MLRAIRTWIEQNSYRTLTRAIQPIAPLIVNVRRLRGKEDPIRWPEKLGEIETPRPDGPLVWIHGVGLGEVLSTRGVIEQLSARDPDLNFLVTSGTYQSALVFGNNIPDRTLHQFLPLDCPKFINRFLDHWHPNLSIWIEQDFWPQMINETIDRDIPLALLNGRMDDRSFNKRNRFKQMFRRAYGGFGHMAAQDQNSADNIAELSGKDVSVMPSLKTIAPPLFIDAEDFDYWSQRLKNRFVWCVGSAHIEDAEAAIQAQERLVHDNLNMSLTIVPRYQSDFNAIEAYAKSRGLSVEPTDSRKPADVLIETGMGKTALWYTLSKAALIGGTFGDTGGHNPWEAVQHDCAVFHGPNIQNFEPDFARLTNVQATFMVPTERHLAERLLRENLEQMAIDAKWCIADQKVQMAPIFDKIWSMVT